MLWPTPICHNLLQAKHQCFFKRLPVLTWQHKMNSAFFTFTALVSQATSCIEWPRENPCKICQSTRQYCLLRLQNITQHISIYLDLANAWRTPRMRPPLWPYSDHSSIHPIPGTATRPNQQTKFNGKNPKVAPNVSWSRYFHTKMLKMSWGFHWTSIGLSLPFPQYSTAQFCSIRFFCVYYW